VRENATGRLITAPSTRSPMLYPTELQARPVILAGYSAAVNVHGAQRARKRARQLPNRVLEVSVSDDRVAPIDALGLVAGDLHGDRARHAGALEVVYGGASESCRIRPATPAASQAEVHAFLKSRRRVDERKVRQVILNLLCRDREPVKNRGGALPAYHLVKRQNERGGEKE
jgi:hypothetical protein